MASLDTLREVLKSRVRLKTPAEESDAVYKIDPTVLDEIIKHSAVAHNPSFTSVEVVPYEQEPFVLLLAEIEVYYALAAGNSRFFSISAEGAQINKQERVDHYMKLIQGRQRHYDMLWARFKESNPNQIETGEVIVRSPNMLNRAWRLADRPSISLNAVVVRKDSVDLEWVTPKPMRARFSLYQNTDLIIDEWETPVWASGNFIPLTENSLLIWSTYDPFRNKFRARGLTPATNYKFAVVIVDSLGRWKQHEIPVTTLAEVSS